MPISPRQVLDLTSAALSADYTGVRRAANVIARALADSGQPELAQELRALLRKKGVPLRSSGYVERLPVDTKSRLALVEEQPWPTTPLFLGGSANSIFRDFVADAQHVDELSSKGLSSRLAMLLSGPPGTGKSLLAGHVAAQLKRPLYVVRLDGLISSLLGDTAKNVRAVFDFIPAKDSVLFLDEMDAIAKLRDDKNELGELKRVVNTVIQGIDALDDHAIVIGATNHPHLLDRAIWRRFPYKIELGVPDLDTRREMWRYFLGSNGSKNTPALLAQISEGLTGADIETIAQMARRNAHLNRAKIDLAGVVEAILLTVGGVPTLPTRVGVSQNSKRDVARRLHELGLNAPKIAALLKVTRQWARKLLKENGDG